MSISADSFLA